MPNPLGFAALLALVLPVLAITPAPSQPPTDPIMPSDSDDDASKAPLYAVAAFVVLAVVILAFVIVRRELREGRRLQAEADANFTTRTFGNGNENGGRHVERINIPNASFSPVSSSVAAAANVDRQLPSLPSLPADGAEPTSAGQVPPPAAAAAAAAAATSADTPLYEMAPGPPEASKQAPAPGDIVYGESSSRSAALAGGIIYDTSPIPGGASGAGADDSSGGPGLYSEVHKPAAAAVGGDAIPMYSMVAKPTPQSPPPAADQTASSDDYASPTDVASTMASLDVGHAAQQSEPTYGFQVPQGAVTAGKGGENAAADSTGNTELVNTGGTGETGGGDLPTYEAAPAGPSQSKVAAALYATVTFGDAGGDATIPEPTFEHTDAEYTVDDTTTRDRSYRPAWLHQVNRPEAEQLLGDPVQAQSVSEIRYLVRPDQKSNQAFVLSFVAAGRAHHTKFGQDSSGAFNTVRQGSIVKLGPSVTDAVPKMLSHLAKSFTCDNLVPVERAAATEIEI